MAINVWKVSSGTEVTSITEEQIATAAQTVFTLVDFTYVIGANLMVFINGVKQIKGAANAYEETSTSVITFTEGLDAGDIVEFVNFV